MVPTITSVTPIKAFTGGQLLTINGTGFQTRYDIDPATPHPWPTPLPTVAVTIGGSPARRVVSVSSTKITCLTGPRDPGATAITVQNLAQDGSAIAGEAVTRTGLLTFARVDLSVKSDLALVIDTLINELRRQVIENVSTTTSVDFSSDPDSIIFAGVEHAKLPALCLSGPTAGAWNRAYNTTPEFITLEAPGEYAKRVTAATQDLVFQLLILDNHSQRSINLEALVTRFFRDNVYLYVSMDPAQPSLGMRQYELESTPYSSTTVNNANDIRSFIGTVTIKGYQFVDVAGFPGQSILERTEEVSDIRLTLTEFPPA